jgi:predicted nucleic acid-binding protein
MVIRTLRVYADTSVFGGVFDEEFEAASSTFFQQVRAGQFQLVISPVIQAEIEAAPQMVRSFFDEMLAIAELIDVSEQALQLRNAYIEAGIVTPKSATDALHVALATIAGCSLIVSWNFKHIVRFDKVPLYRAVNVLNGYTEIGIFSPLEVISYEED